MTELAVYLDLVALIPPIAGLLQLARRKVSLQELKARTVAAISLYFIATIIFDVLRHQGFTWAEIAIPITLWLVFSSIGFLAANLCYCPETRTRREALSKILRIPSFHAYGVTVLAWLAVTLYFRSPNLYANILLWTSATLYPSLLFRAAKKRAQSNHVRDMLKILLVAWLGVSAVSLPALLLGPDSPLGFTLPYNYQVLFITGSLYSYFMSLAVADPSGISRLWMPRLVPQTLIEFGKRYLVIHDAGNRTQSFLANTFRGIIESGGKVVVRAPQQSWLLDSLKQDNPKFTDWMKTGRLVSVAGTEKPAQTRSEKAGPGITSTLFVRDLESGDLLDKDSGGEPVKEKDRATSELLLIQSTKAPRPQLNEFLKRNGDVKVVDLSEPKDYFSSRLNLRHNQLQGSSILLEYDSSSDLGVVEKFFQEGISYAEKCVLFTSKSSNLYRAFKGRELVKVVATSSLASRPEELPDGEVQIPDKELGLVTSIVNELLENHQTTAVRIVFDSIGELIRAQHWEQLYSGVKQLVELLTVPQATSIILVYTDTSEPHFLGALRALFSVQMKLDRVGLQVRKIPL